MESKESNTTLKTNTSEKKPEGVDSSFEDRVGELGKVFFNKEEEINLKEEIPKQESKEDKEAREKIEEIEKKILETKKPDEEEVDEFWDKFELSSEEEKELKETQEEVEEMPEKERKSLLRGIVDVSYALQEWKSASLSNLFKKAVGKKDGKKIQERGLSRRFLNAYSESYKEKAELAKKNRKRERLGIIRGGGSLLKTTGNFIKLGRIVWDAGYANPFRHIMAGSMFVAKNSEMLKEARLKRDKVIEKTRIKDADEAAEEAKRIHEKAEMNIGKGKKVSTEDLEKEYQKILTSNLGKRLEKRNKKDGFILSRVTQNFGSLLINSKINRIDKKISKIKQNEKLSPDKQKERIEIYLERQKKNLDDYDRMVSTAGTIDLLSYTGRAIERTGKAVSIAMIADTFYRLPKIFASFTESSIETELSEEPIKPRVIRQKIAFPAEAPEPSQMVAKPSPIYPESSEPIVTEGTELPKELSATEPVSEVQTKDFIETVGKGDSIWKMAEDQLEEHYGNKFADLDEARKTYMIDAIKDKMIANPEKFGLESIDKLKVGQKVDFSSIFEDESELEKISEKAEALKETAVENIEKNNEMLRDWVEDHPKEMLTSEKVENILSGESEKFSLEGQEDIYKNFLKDKGFKLNNIIDVGKLPEELGGDKTGGDFRAMIKIDDKAIDAYFDDSGTDKARVTFEYGGRFHELKGKDITFDKIKEVLEGYKFSPYEERAMQMLGLTSQDYLTKFDKVEIGKLLSGDYKSEILGADKRFTKYINELIKIRGMEKDVFLNKMTISGFLKMFG